MANTRSFKPKTTPSASSGLDIDQLVGDPVPQDQSSAQFEQQPSSNYRESAGSSYRDSGYDEGYSERRGYGRRSSGPMNPEPQMRDVPTEQVNGYLDIQNEGHGFLRPKYTPSDRDVYISASQIRRFNLRPGDFVEGGARQPKEYERYFG